MASSAIRKRDKMKAINKGLAILTSAVALATAPTLALAQEGPLVTVDWLQENLSNPDAVNLAWHTDLVDTVRRDIVSSDGLEAILREAGVTEDTTVVLYGDNNNWFAAWGAWVFDVHGLGEVKLLDGGRKLWEAQGL